MATYRTAIVAAALAVACALPASGAQAQPTAPAPDASAARTSSALTALLSATQRRARANHRKVVACSSRRPRGTRAHPRARRACKPHAKAKHPIAPHRRRSTVAPAGGTAQTAAPQPAAPPASTAPCADTDLIPDPTNLDRVNAAALCLVNQVRGQHGLGELVVNANLQRAAQRHSDDQVAQDYFSHQGPSGDDPLSRMQDAGYISDGASNYVVGENIAWGTLTLATPAAMVDAWVHSPEHLANILDSSYRDTGLAAAASAPASLAAGQAGAIYTEDFGGLGG